ncbi:MAG: erythromycin esterase family protein, partial [Actinomycetales bacterium]
RHPTVVGGEADAEGITGVPLPPHLTQDGWLAEEDFFFAEQNARVVLSAERYYRHMYHGQVASWNMRDRHMANTLESLLVHLNRDSATPRWWSGPTTPTWATRVPPSSADGAS